jgi:sec-independent protein translocase protein TatB
MFDIGWGELIVIGVVALVAIGPKELPTVLRTVGQWMGKVRRMASEFQGQFQEAMREAEFAELKKQVDAVGETARGMTPDLNPLETVRKEMEGAMEDKPKSADAPASAAAPAESGDAAAQPAPQQPPVATADVQVPLPEPAPPLTERDFAGDPPSPPQAGGGRAA